MLFILAQLFSLAVTVYVSIVLIREMRGKVKVYKIVLISLLPLFTLAFFIESQLNVDIEFGLPSLFCLSSIFLSILQSCCGTDFKRKILSWTKGLI